MSDDQTSARMADPRPGDRFSEMWSYWVEVLFREGDDLLYWDSGIAEDGPPKLASTGEFRARFSYRAIPGYWVRYHDSKGMVMADDEARAWMVRISEEYRQARMAQSMLGASL